MEGPGAPAGSDGCCCYEIQHTADRGRILVASRAIARGELILEETPLLIAPAVAMPMCLRCFKFISDCQRPVRCKSCGLGFCGPECQAELEEVHRRECALLCHDFFRRWLEENPRAAWAICRGLATRQCHPEVWKRLRELPAPTRLKEHADLSAQVTAVCHGIEEIGTVERGDVELLLGVCSTYAHLCWRAPQEADEQLCTNSLLGLFQTASVPEHSCVPSCFKSFWHRGKDVTIQLRALRDLEVGEPLSLSYSDLSEPTHLRQANLKDKGFRCSCARCRDPTECGSSLSSLKCPACGSGFVSPPCADYELLEKPWPCGGCSVQLPWSALRAFEQSLEVRLHELEAEVMEDYDGKAALVKFRDSCRPRLHPGHWVILRCNLAIGTFHQLAMMEEPELGRQHGVLEAPPSSAAMMEEPELGRQHGVLEACDEALQVLAAFGPEFDDCRARLHASRAVALAGSGEEDACRCSARELRASLYGEDRADAVC